DIACYPPSIQVRSTHLHLETGWPNGCQVRVDVKKHASVTRRVRPLAEALGTPAVLKLKDEAAVLALGHQGGRGLFTPVHRAGVHMNAHVVDGEDLVRGNTLAVAPMSVPTRERVAVEEGHKLPRHSRVCSDSRAPGIVSDGTVCPRASRRRAAHRGIGTACEVPSSIARGAQRRLFTLSIHRRTALKTPQPPHGTDQASHLGRQRAAPLREAPPSMRCNHHRPERYDNLSSSRHPQCTQAKLSLAAPRP